MKTVLTPRPVSPFASASTDVDPAVRENPNLRAAATSAGVGIVLLAVLATFGVLFAVDGLITPGDAARTARRITGSETLFRLGIVSLLVTAIVDVVVAFGLYGVFRQTSSGLSMLAASFRLAYATVFLVAVGHLLTADRLLHAPSGAFTATQNQARALEETSAFHDVFTAGLVLFGVHLLLVGYLAYRSGFVPRLLAFLVCVAGVGYAFDSIASVLSNDSTPSVASVTFAGELFLGAWLLVRGRHLNALPRTRRQARAR